MIGSIKIGSAFGIPVRVHWTFLFLFYLVRGADPLSIVLTILLVFGCVLLHELGHSLVAKGFGIRVVDITFWPLGGMARMTEIPENSRIEGLVAIAGPAVNFALAGIGILAAVTLEVLGLSGAGACGAFAGLNVMQGTFNLLPAFPMDGGRLLRAFLARKRSWLAATETAVRIGRVVAALLFAAALVLMSLTGLELWLLVLIPAFVWFAGARELFAVRLRHGVFPFGASWRPANGSPGAAPSPQGDQGEPGGTRPPFTFDPRTIRGGFDDEAIRKLEAFRGRLKKPPEERS